MAVESNPIRCEARREVDGQQCFMIKHGRADGKHRFTPATDTRWKYSPEGSLGPWDRRTTPV